MNINIFKKVQLGKCYIDFALPYMFCSCMGCAFNFHTYLWFAWDYVWINFENNGTCGMKPEKYLGWTTKIGIFGFSMSITYRKE